jgi:hypothetical protein
MPKYLRLAVVSAVILTANAAWAASGTDPNDTTGGIDILRSSVNTIEREDGHKRVVVRAETEDPMTLETGHGSLYWQLDTRGGGDHDYEVYVFGDPEANDPPGPIYCLVQKPNGAKKLYVHVSVDEDVARCAIPRSHLTIDKSIRWRVAGRLDGVIDRAPNVGWYG